MHFLNMQAGKGQIMGASQQTKLVILGGIVLFGSVAGGYFLGSRNDGEDSSTTAPNWEDAVTGDAPLELAGISWVRNGCAGNGAIHQFENGRMIEFDGFGAVAARYKVKFAKTADGWKVIRPNETYVYALNDGVLQFKGFEIAGELIVTPNGAVFSRCSKEPFAHIQDVTPSPVKEPLRYALWEAIVMKDAAAVKRIIDRMPTIEGGINMEGDPDKQPDIDVLLPTATREIYQLIQKKRDKISVENPEDAYATENSPWITVPEIPSSMWGSYIVPDRAGGCNSPNLSISSTRIVRDVFGQKHSNIPGRIAISGKRVWLQHEPRGGESGGGTVYELQADGSLLQIANLSASGASVSANGNDHYLRCSSVDTSEPEISNGNEGAGNLGQSGDLSSPARLIGSPQRWITYDDYPVQALREQREGTTDFRLTFNERGSVVACEVTSSSGHTDLDAETCAIMRRRARFYPGKGRAGNPMGGTYSNRIRWQIPR
jgi:TonB family protein